MLPSAQCRIYENFRGQLLQLLQTVKSIAQDSLTSVDRAVVSHRAGIPAEVVQLQLTFREQVLTMPLEDINPTHRAKVQSYQAEISKELRLVGLDCTFFLAARQAETWAQRGQQVIDRIETLIRYCDGILEQPGNHLPKGGEIIETSC